MLSLRRLVRPVARPALALLRRAGFDVVRTGSAAIAPDRLRRAWLARLGIDLVIDVGANEGQFVGWMRQGGYSGRIVSFEPQKSAFEALSARHGRDPRWAGVRSALGDAPAELSLQVAGNSMSSSLLPMLRTHVEALPESAIVAEEAVPVARLDALMGPRLGEARRIFLKIDTQGYERPVLRGASGLLDRVALLELELSLVPLYEGQALLPEMMTEVAALGFTPITLEPGFADEGRARLLQMDGLFVRTALIEAVEPARVARAALA